MIGLLNECLSSMKKSSNSQLLLEMCLFNISNLFKETSDDDNVKSVSNISKESVKNKDKNNIVSVIHKNVFDDSGLKKIRVDNTLSRFNKNVMRGISEQLSLVKNYVVDDTYGKWASLILDGKFKAASDEYLIFVYDNSDVSNMFNESIKFIEQLVGLVLSKNYKVISVSSDEWEKIRSDFNSKKRTFIYSEEVIVDTNQSGDDEIADMFSDIVEYKQKRGLYMNLQAMMKQAQQLQKKMLDEKKAIDEKVFEGKSSLVTVTMTGDKKAKSIDFPEEAVEDIEMLQDMIILAFNDAISKIDKETEDKMGKYTQGMPGLFQL